MKRYFFDRREDGTTFIDEEGLELADEVGAEREAAKAAFDIAKDAARGNLNMVRVTLRDEAGTLLAVEVKFEIMRKTEGGPAGQKAGA